MASDNKIYPFAQAAVPPNILDDADYAASSITTTTGYVEDTEADAPYMSKAQRQTSCMAAGLGQFIADNQPGTVDVTDDLEPDVIAAMLLAAVGRGNLSNSFSYSVNTTLTAANLGGIVVPTIGSLAFQLPLVAGMPNGAQITFNGSTYGCVISRQGSDTILAGTSGAVTALSLEQNDTGVLTVINGQWCLTDGELHQGVSSSFVGSLTNDGWAPFAGGLILQWGSDTFPASGTTTATTAITFPKTFPNSCFIVLSNSNIIAPVAGNVAIASSQNKTTSGYDCVGYTNGLFTSPTPFSWLALGK